MDLPLESNPRTLYVGNLDPSVNEDLILALFGRIGPCKGCKIINEPGNDPYAFVEFADHGSAQAALMAMNKRMCLGRAPTIVNAPLVNAKEMKVNWATSPGNQPKQDTSKHFHIFVGDLSPDIETHQLREAFAPFGQISDCKIIRDPQTLKSKGYGFVSYVKKEDAENAIQGMNGQWIGSRAIRTNWATRKPPAPSQKEITKSLCYEEVYGQSSPTNCTVYCGGIQCGLSDELMRRHFSQYGNIQEIRVFKDKGYAFIRFSTKEAATQAIVKTHGVELSGQMVKCSWGKESTESSSNPGGTQPGATVGAASQPHQSESPWYGDSQGQWSENSDSENQQQFSNQNYGSGQPSYYGQMGYWGYPQGYGQMQQSGYMQPYMQQGYGYSGYGMQMQWPSMQMQPGQQQQYNGQQQGMMGYPMQQGN